MLHQDAHKIPNSHLFFQRLNPRRQIQPSNKYQIDRLIHEDARRDDSSNLHETQARAAKRNNFFFFFDAWIPLLSLVHRKFSWAAGPVIDLLNGFILHYLSGRLRVMDEVQGSNKKHICIHPIKCFTKKRHLFCCFEQGPAWSFPHMVLINSRGPQYYSFDTACWKYPNTNSHCTANRLSCRHNHFHRWPMRYLTKWKSFNKKEKLYQWHQYKQLWGLSAVGPLLSTYRCSG